MPPPENSIRGKKKNKKLHADCHQASTPQDVGRRWSKLLTVRDGGKKALLGMDTLSRVTSLWHTLHHAGCTFQG